MPLSLAPRGEKMCIKRIGGDVKIKHHLGNLGFTPGSEVMVVSSCAGNMIVNIKDTRIGIDEKLASKIMI